MKDLHASKTIIKPILNVTGSKSRCVRTGVFWDRWQDFVS